MKFLFRTPLIPLVLVPLLIGQPVWAQAAISPASGERGEGEVLQLRVVSPDSTRISANSHSQGFTIQVTDSQGVPVPEAAVAFRLPDSGASGIFPDGSHSAVVYTDSAGIARVDSIQWSETPGTAPIRITANKDNAHAGLLVEQTLVPPGVSPLIAAAEPVRSAPSLPSPAVPPVAALRAAPSVSVESIGRRGTPALDSSFRRSETEPSVSVVSSSETNSIGGSKKKWIILGIVIAAGAGAGFAFANKGKSSSTAAASSSISFGSPTVSVGHP
jgi:hypothetical protein